MKNLATSIKDRLLNLSRSTGRDFQMLLERFAMGRLLWRLVHSERKFVLKGAQLFSVWQETPHRPTRDLDLLSFGSSSVEDMRAFFEQVLAPAAEPEDCLVWTHLAASRIREDERYGRRQEQADAVELFSPQKQAHRGFAAAHHCSPAWLFASRTLSKGRELCYEVESGSGLAAFNLNQARSAASFCITSSTC